MIFMKSFAVTNAHRSRAACRESNGISYSGRIRNMKPNRLLFAEMTRLELRAIAADTTVVLPIGATEQHGPHLPAGTDFFAVDHLAQAAAERAGAEVAITVAPVLPFGSSDHHLTFGATLSLGTETYYRVLRDLLRSLVTD